MSEVVIPLQQAIEQGFPDICAITGGRADGAIPLRAGRSRTRWRSPLVRIPLSESVFRKWSRRQGIHIKARGIASVLTAVAVVITFRNSVLGVSILAVAVVIHLIDLWAERTSSEVQPKLERRGNDLAISDVHPRFAEAVAEIVRDNPRAG
jgi:hypothetical protein